MTSLPDKADRVSFRYALTALRQELESIRRDADYSKAHHEFAGKLLRDVSSLEIDLGNFDRKPRGAPGRPSTDWFSEQRILERWGDAIGMMMIPVALWATIGALALGVVLQALHGEGSFRMVRDPISTWKSGFYWIGAALLAMFGYAGFRGIAKSTEAADRKYLEGIANEESGLFSRAEQILTEYRNWNREEQQKLSALSDLSTKSIMSAKAAAFRISNASSIRNQAEIEFGKGALVSFWDHVERCIEGIGKAAEFCSDASRERAEFSRVLSSYKGSSPVPCVPIASGALEEIQQSINKVATLTKELTYNAQFNPNFAQIYEMRRNTTTLVSGFKSLGDAILSLGDRITASIDNLQQQISSDLRRIDESIVAVESAIYSSANLLADRIDASSDEVRKVSGAFASAVEATEANGRFTRAALVEGIRSDHEIKVMLAGVTGKVSPGSLAHVRGLYGTLLDPGPQVPKFSG